MKPSLNIGRQLPCTRLYPNGALAVDFRTDVDSWMLYNETSRPECALFVNGELKSAGNTLTEEKALQLYAERTKALPNN